jgi:ABC-type thiamine transport system substrate-binding protein
VKSHRFSILLTAILCSILFVPSLGFARGSRRRAPDNAPVTILTYSSSLGKGSLGEWIEKHVESPCRIHTCKFITPHPNRSLFEELRFRQGRPSEKIDLILGIDSNQLAWARENKLVSDDKILLGESPIVILEHSKTGTNSAPMTMGEAIKFLKHGLILQDPRFSALAQTFLIWGVGKKAFTLQDLKSATARVFPKWSASFEYFLKTPKLALLTFGTSQSYNDCSPGSPGTRLFPLKGSLPLYQEWIVPSPQLEKRAVVRDFVKFFERPDFAQAVSQLNWLIPRTGVKSTAECFQKNLPKETSSAETPAHKTYQEWMDLWAL